MKQEASHEDIEVEDSMEIKLIALTTQFVQEISKKKSVGLYILSLVSRTQQENPFGENSEN